MSETTQEPLDRKDLKILGLQQRLAELEEKYLEMQIDYTIVVQELQRRDAAQSEGDTETVDAEVVSDDETQAVL